MEYIILIVSLAGIVFGADFLVAGAVSIARKFKVSDFVIGAAIVGVGTSMPELVVSFIGAVNGKDMTTEAALTKLYHLFSLDIPKEEIKQRMSMSLRGELNP